MTKTARLRSTLRSAAPTNDMTDEALPAHEEAHRPLPDPDEPPRVLLHMPVDVRSLR